MDKAKNRENSIGTLACFIVSLIPLFSINYNRFHSLVADLRIRLILWLVVTFNGDCPAHRNQLLFKWKSTFSTQLR